MKNKSKIRWGKWWRLYNIINHDEKLQNLLITICCFSLILLIALYCWISR